MHPEPYPAADQAQADLKWAQLADKSWKERSGTEYWESKGEFWFDYISDTGDGTRATYSIAYLCLSRLWVEGALADLQQNFPALPDKVGFMVDEGFAPVKGRKYTNKELNRHQKQIDSKTQTKLPRGEFLLVGGDTTYHLSDYDGLHTRFQTPFCWAFKDAVEDGRLWLRSKDTEWNDLRRPLFGIPGNHDYYDQLDGFRRQFRNPVKKDEDIDPND
ncbi:MAG: metallophosphoesterase, partial [Acidobacteria bacterium]|nr:metallophosphoesterase [Acidobacteriota bacterium]